MTERIQWQVNGIVHMNACLFPGMRDMNSINNLRGMLEKGAKCDILFHPAFAAIVL